MNIDEQALERLYRPVGEMTVTWAISELALDFCVILVFSRLGGRRHRNQTQSALSWKLRFLREMAEKIDELQPMKAAMKSLCDDFERLSEIRHAFTHGAATQVDPDLKVIFIRIQRVEGVFKERNDALDLANFPGFLAELRVLVVQTTRLAWDLIRLAGVEPA